MMQGLALERLRTSTLEGANDPRWRYGFTAKGTTLERTKIKISNLKKGSILVTDSGIPDCCCCCY